MILWNSSYNSADSCSSWGQSAGMTHSSSRHKEHNGTDSAFITPTGPEGSVDPGCTASRRPCSTPSRPPQRKPARHGLADTHGLLRSEFLLPERKQITWATAQAVCHITSPPHVNARTSGQLQASKVEPNKAFDKSLPKVSIWVSLPNSILTQNHHLPHPAANVESTPRPNTNAPACTAAAQRLPGNVAAPFPATPGHQAGVCL